MAMKILDLLSVAGRRPSLPPGLRVYAIGDIHGQLDLLERLIDKIWTDKAVRPIVRPVLVFLGDYLDRGPSSCQVIDLMIKISDQVECVFLKGNHEEIALRCLTDASVFEQWLRLGGGETLRSYDVPLLPPSPETIPRMQSAFYSALSGPQLTFFRNLENSIVCGDFFFVHAGVRPGIPLDDQKATDLLWIREPFLSSPADFGKIVVHGHSPVGDVDFRRNRINVDTGAFASQRLSCVAIDQDTVTVLDTRES
jgi:serine/threonine protein phosphatase 1